jgi:hypothetical protein
MSIVRQLPCKPCDASTLLGSVIGSSDTLHVQSNSEIQITNYLDCQGVLIVDGVFGVQ